MEKIKGFKAAHKKMAEVNLSKGERALGVSEKKVARRSKPLVHVRNTTRSIRGSKAMGRK